MKTAGRTLRDRPFNFWERDKGCRLILEKKNMFASQMGENIVLQLGEMFVFQIVETKMFTSGSNGPLPCHSFRESHLCFLQLLILGLQLS